MEDYKIIFQNSLENLKNKGSFSTSMLEKAFLFAEEKHAGQFRKSGDPYIKHPVEVMAILEKLDLGSDVLCSALLHDVVEDCGVTTTQLSETFNPLISQIVDAVSEIKPNEKIENIEAEIQTYQKLVSMGKINLFAFYIKFADRLHNLRTIGSFPRYKQVEKVKQTQRFVLPLAKILKAKQLYSQITNECFKVISSWQNEFEPFINMYNYHLQTNEKYNSELQEELMLLTNQLLTKSNVKNSLKNILIIPSSELEIVSEAEKVYEIKNIGEIKPNFYVNIPTFQLFFIFNNADYTDFIFKLLEDKQFKKILKLKNFDYDDFSKKEYFLFESAIREKFQTFFMSQTQYTVFRNGSEEGVDSAMLESDFEAEIIADYITVKTRSNEIILMPKGSTVLDFAFKIHNDLGFACKHALLNDSPAKTPINTKLSDGDKVSLIVEEDENGNKKNIARLKWLTIVNNEKAKKTLLKYFENLYE